MLQSADFLLARAACRRHFCRRLRQPVSARHKQARARASARALQGGFLLEVGSVRRESPETIQGGAGGELWRRRNEGHAGHRPCRENRSKVSSLARFLMVLGPSGHDQRVSFCRAEVDLTVVLVLV